ncbi:MULTISPECIES: sigma-54 dependent transcriptional regulator [unclassified Neptuniibacter]|jgi:two-component system C4-dicarboxylate transport response regulator DctD|uniref:sigma-54-dependent transcriptional regulator n=1 Tax=unclassified Neptuniibacter TaxID=2630693 RepID=UPI0026E12EA8|nr:MULTISPECIES: sigma-54 dependent transcriptional regulator [unclassified Neptuniibacter]MDO6514879.1 sigma-54 dependent transcriptional regulator [Neptuniibacter sp. 2_MG-2023]MDO6594544.1 sigma-54 dependent transcriptional regulator [Neptuniibacter sp. 1_MG-2023]
MSDQSPLPIILVDDEKHIRLAAGQALELGGYDVTTLETAEQALSIITSDWPGILITDINLPGIDGLDLMKQVVALDATLPVILITGHGDISMAVSAMRDGAYDFIEKPFSSELLLDVVRRAIEKRHLIIENRRLKQELEAQSVPGPRIIGKTGPIAQVRNLVHTIADTPADILILGETGTGKDLLARYIHEHSHRSDKNFVAINCGAVPENLIESELFGHEKGAFTDAKARRIGKFEYANEGTLFLDEIESMPMTLQIKLLRVLEDRSIERLGANEIIPLDLRVIAATKVDLKEAAERGEFREDLYYRLNVVRVDIPALRERRDDVGMLFQHFALIASSQYGREVPLLSPERMHSLMMHDWPGNVRELRNLAERYVLLGESCSFDFENRPITDVNASNHMTLPDKVDQFERMLIQAELSRCGGSIKETLISLGLPRKTLYDKMKKYGLDKKDFK